MPVLGPKPARISLELMSLYNRRFKVLALKRRAAGEEGRRNDGRRYRAYFNLNLAPFHMVMRGFWIWMVAEADGVRLSLKSLFGRAPAPETPVESDAPAETISAGSR
jgi:hypothetical protein